MANDWFSSFTAFIAFALARVSDLNTMGNSLVSAFDKLPFKRPLNEDRTTFATDSGVANAYVLTLSNVQTAQRPTDYQPGFRVSFAPLNASTGACTVNVYNPSGVLIGAANITLDGRTAPAAGALAPPKLVTLEYDGASFQIVSGGLSVTGGMSINSGIKIDGADTTFGTLVAKLLPLGALKSRIVSVAGNEGMQIKLGFSAVVTATAQTAAVGSITPVDTSGGAIAVLNLPALGAGDTLLQDGDVVILVDAGGAIETNNVTAITGNAGNIVFMGQAAVATIAWNGPNFSMLIFRWNFATSQWIGNGFD